MLPFWKGEGLASPKNGNIAIPKLIEKMQSYGSTIKNMQAKLFGGGEVIEIKNNLFNIGKRNIEVAYQLLEEYKIPIVSSSVGGKYGRKILFDTQSGMLKQKLIQKNSLNDL